MFLIEMVIHRARELREFILLTWDEKKKRIREYWRKYWRIYLFLFLFAAIIAFINVYIDWLSVKTHGSPRSGTGTSSQSGGDGPEDNKNKDNQPAADTNTTKAANTNQKTKPGDNPTNISDVSTPSGISGMGFSKKSEIRERRLAKQSQMSKTSISDSLSGVGNTMSSALNGGVGKALSVIGIFFSVIIGLFLFCSAPVVLFYMWMKKLIMPLFPSRG